MTSFYGTQTIQDKTFIEHLADYFAPRLRERRDEAERLSNTDAMTGLPNRRAFDMAERQAKADGQMFILFDLNSFGKSINSAVIPKATEP